MAVIDTRLERVKSYHRAMRFYVLMLHEIVLESKPENILEIGTQHGQSTKSMLTALGKIGKGKLLSLDHKSRGEILAAEFPDLKQYWEFYKGDTHKQETFEKAKNFLEEGKMYDILFIDGDHTYEGAKKDFVQYSRLVKPGGIVIFHDTVNTNEGVNRVWAEIDWPEKFNFDWGTVANSLVVGLGITRKPLGIEEIEGEPV